MPPAHLFGPRAGLLLPQNRDDLLFREAASFHRPSPFSGDGLYLISAEFSGCRPRGQPLAPTAQVILFSFLSPLSPLSTHARPYTGITAPDVTRQSSEHKYAIV